MSLVVADLFVAKVKPSENQSRKLIGTFDHLAAISKLVLDMVYCQNFRESKVNNVT